jgi:nucleotide-binding universal stress UspA family protein
MSAKMKLLIGYDGSESANAMIGDLRRAGLPRSVELVVLSVADVWMPPDSLPNDEIVEAALAEQMTRKAREKALHSLEEARVLAARAGDKIVSLFPEWDIRTEAHAGSPAWELIVIADEWKPDLIVVGSQGRSALGKLWFGSVSHKVVHEALCSVRVARGRERKNGNPVKIIIGVDGSPDSLAAVEQVAQRSWPAGSKVCLITSIGSSPSGSIDGPLSESGQYKTMQEAIDGTQKLYQKLESELKERGLEVTSLVKHDDPRHALVAEAEDQDADSIFVGSRGLSRFKRFMLGSVSTTVVSRAHCSVEVVRRKENSSIEFSAGC